MLRHVDRRNGAAADLGLAGLILSVALLAGSPAEARGLLKFGGDNKADLEKKSIDSLLPSVDQALAEDRLVDAGQLLDTAYAAGAQDPRLFLRSGELQLTRGRNEDAIRSFTTAETDPALKASALQGRGIALARLGRADEGVRTLQEAVRLDPSLWRAWNSLGVERDRRRDWTGAEDAYRNALQAPAASAIVLNNRGYSRLLQGRYQEASSDFVQALQKDPGLTSARTNLRLSLALQGDYQRATAVSGTEDRAVVLNNAGFAAIMRGDLGAAEGLFKQAIDLRGATYGRAIENLQMVRALQAAEAKPATKTP